MFLKMTSVWGNAIPLMNLVGCAPKFVIRRKCSVAYSRHSNNKALCCYLDYNMFLQAIKSFLRSPERKRKPAIVSNKPTLDNVLRIWKSSDVQVVCDCARPSPSQSSWKARNGIVLTAWDNSFEDLFYKWRNNYSALFLWNSDQKLRSRKEIKRDIRYMLQNTEFYFVRHDKMYAPIGFAYSLNFTNPTQKFRNVTIFLSPENQNVGHSVAATLLFVQYLFSTYNITKVVSEVYAWNVNSIRSTEHLKEVRLEGTRMNHAYWNGRFHDIYEYALTRDAFHRIMRSKLWKRVIGEGVAH